MPELRHFRGRASRAAAILVLLGCAAGFLRAQNSPAPLTITTGAALPNAIPRSDYSFQLRAQGGVPPIQWSADPASLPPGLTLEATTGIISGVPRALGQFRFEVKATDSSSPPMTVKRTFSLAVISALALRWTRPPAVNQDRIDGSVEVMNQTAGDVDMTVIVVAVNEIGKAFALGYEHFTASASSRQTINFGFSLPRGAYVVHADAVGEVPEQYIIHRTRLQTGPLLTP